MAGFFLLSGMTSHGTNKNGCRCMRSPGVFFYIHCIISTSSVPSSEGAKMGVSRLFGKLLLADGGEEHGKFFFFLVANLKFLFGWACISVRRMRIHLVCSTHGPLGLYIWGSCFSGH